MRTYKSHKTVKAAKITGIHYENLRGAGLKLGDYVAHVDAPWVKRHLPEGATIAALVGGYVVEYGDGYLSWSPARAFEDGYTVVEEPTPTANVGRRISRSFASGELPPNFAASDAKPTEDQGCTTEPLYKHPPKAERLDFTNDATRRRLHDFAQLLHRSYGYALAEVYDGNRHKLAEDIQTLLGERP